jgi:mono/diheme cytochrome c family protein
VNKACSGLVVVLAAVVAAGAASAQETGDRARGQKLFMTYGCYECHGTTGHGGNGAGPQLAPPPIPLPAMINQLRHPTRMPRYADAVLSDAQIADIHAYLAASPPSKPAAQIPLLANLK